MHCVDNRFRVTDQQRRKLAVMGCRRNPARLRQMAQALFISDPRKVVRSAFARAIDSIFEVPEALCQYGATSFGTGQT